MFKYKQPKPIPFQVTPRNRPAKIHFMAEHCINFHLKTNEHWLNEQEKRHPVPPEDLALIRSTFKEEYHRPMRDWMLIQSDKKRARLLGLIRCQPSTKILPQPLADSSRMLSYHYQADPRLVSRSATGVIDLNRSFYGDAPRRFLNSKRFAPTAISTEGIFGFPTSYATRSIVSEDSPKYSEFIVKKLFQPAAAREISLRADEYFDLLQVLLKWVDKKTNQYPIDPIRGRKSLEPRTEGALTKAKNEEDHMYPAGHRPITKAQLPKGLRSRGGAQAIKNFMTSHYTDSFCDESHQEWLKSTPRVTDSCKPIQNPAPYAMFPGNPFERERAVFDEYILQQSRENSISGKINRDIFNSKTCL